MTASSSVRCPGIATRPSTSTTGMSRSAASGSKRSGRSRRGARYIEGARRTVLVVNRQHKTPGPGQARHGVSVVAAIYGIATESAQPRRPALPSLGGAGLDGLHGAFRLRPGLVSHSVDDGDRCLGRLRPLFHNRAFLRFDVLHDVIAVHHLGLRLDGDRKDETDNERTGQCHVELHRVLSQKSNASLKWRITSLTNHGVVRKGPESTQTGIETPAGVLRRD